MREGWKPLAVVGCSLWVPGQSLLSWTADQGCQVVEPVNLIRQITR